MVGLKPVRLTEHARLQSEERGTCLAEIVEAIRRGERELARHGRWAYRLNLQFAGTWMGKHYEVKQVVPVVAEEVQELVVITVYTFYF